MSIASAVILSLVVIALLVTLLTLQFLQQKRFAGAFAQNLEQFRAFTNRVEKQGTMLDALTAQSKQLRDQSDSLRREILESIGGLWKRTSELGQLADASRLQSETAYRESEQALARLRDELRATSDDARNRAEVIESVVRDLESLIRRSIDVRPVFNSRLLTQSNQAAWAIVDHADQVVAVLDEIPFGESIDTSLCVSSEWKTQVQALLQSVPNFAADLANMGRKAYLLKFSSEVAKGLQSGSLRLMPAVEVGSRAMAVTRRGEIVEHAVLIQQSPVSAAGFAVIAWQVLAIVTAQHFLASIDRNLKHVNESLNRIVSHLERQRIGRVRAIQKYLNTVAVALNTGQLSQVDLDSWNTQLETLELECNALVEMAEQGRRTALENVCAITFDGFVSNGESYRQCLNRLGEYECESQIYLAGSYLRLLIAQIKYSLPVNRPVAHDRVDQIRRSTAEGKTLHTKLLDALKQNMQSGKLKMFLDNTKDWPNAIRGPLSPITSLVEIGMRKNWQKDAELAENLKQGAKRISDLFEAMERECAATESALADRNGVLGDVVSLRVLVDNGQIVDVAGTGLPAPAR